MARAVAALLLGAACALAVAEAQMAEPAIVPLPRASSPEGMSAGNGDDVWVTTLRGKVIHVDMVANTSTVVHEELGVPLSGTKFCKKQSILFAAGSMTGKAFAYHMVRAGGGEGSPKWRVARREVLKLGEPGLSYINDAALSKDLVYFTDSFGAALFAVPRYALPPAGNVSGAAVPPARPVTLVHMGPAFEVKLGQFKANGLIVYSSATEADVVLVANLQDGNMYSVTVPKTGGSGTAAVGGGAVTLPGLLKASVRRMLPHPLKPDAVVGEVVGEVVQHVLPTVRGSRIRDRLLLDGLWVASPSRVYVADNMNNRIFGLDVEGPGVSALKLACVIRTPHMGVPTTLAMKGPKLWWVNAHLDTCVPILPCLHQHFELLGVDPAEACEPIDA